MKWTFFLLLAGLCALARCLPRQYHFISDALPWLDAQKYCREMFTDLATVEDIEEMNRLVNTAQDTTGGFTDLAWIGLYDNRTSRRWSLSEYYYDDGEANNFPGNQICVLLKSGGVWEDSRCSLRSAFVCYDGGLDTFILVEKKRSWFNAQRYCRRRHTDLATVSNEEENQTIQSLISDKGVWTGLFRQREWSDHSDSTYRYWSHGQPDNAGGQQNCTASNLGNAGLWSDESCSRALAFVCYGEKSETPQSTTAMTPNTITSIIDLISTEFISSGKPSAPAPTPASPIPGETPQSTITMTPNTITSIIDLISTEFISSGKPSTPAPTSASPIPEDLIELELSLSSLKQDIRDLVVQFRNQLVEMGLPNNIRVSLRLSLE